MISYVGCILVRSSLTIVHQNVYYSFETGFVANSRNLRAKLLLLLQSRVLVGLRGHDGERAHGDDLAERYVAEAAADVHAALRHHHLVTVAHAARCRSLPSP